MIHIQIFLKLCGLLHKVFLFAWTFPERSIALFLLKQKQGANMQQNKPTKIKIPAGSIWVLNDKLHREDGPAFTHYWSDYYDGAIRRPGHREKKWYRHGKLHRTDGPAVTEDTWNSDYSQRVILKEKWYRNGKLHRTDGPAAIEGSIKAWYRNGKLHRDGEPALIDSWNFNEQWYSQGKLHRTDGPAVVDSLNHIDQWFYKGKLHREDGPAVEDINGTEEYWIDGEQLTKLAHKFWSKVGNQP